MNAAQKRAMMERSEYDRALKFIPNLKGWPRWPILPMKRGPQNEEQGFLYADNATDDDGVILYKANFLEWADMTPEQRQQVNRINYPTVRSLLDDGWRVD